jgi:hypothetical protein
MRLVALIPARYGSSRFPGKALALVLGKPLIQWVWEQARNVAYPGSQAELGNQNVTQESLGGLPITKRSLAGNRVPKPGLGTRI